MNEISKKSFSKQFKTFRRRITYSEKFKKRIGSFSALLLYAYYKTLKVQAVYHPDYNKITHKKTIYGFWHGRQLLFKLYFKDRQMSTLVDTSWVGDLVSNIAHHYGFYLVRGSSKRKGVKALLNLKSAAEAGWAVSIALDGPRGPVCQAKPGILFLSKKLNHPIVPLITTANNYWTLKTWDRYMIPKPFSKCLIAFGKPLLLSDLNMDEQVKILNLEMNQLMNAIDKKMSRY